MSAKKYAKMLIKRYKQRYAKNKLRKHIILHIKALLSLCKASIDRVVFYNMALNYVKKVL